MNVIVGLVLISLGKERGQKMNNVSIDSFTVPHGITSHMCLLTLN